MFDVAIVGAGIVGLALANSLVKNDISVLLLDDDKGNQAKNKTRVVALSRSSENLLRNLEVWHLLEPHVSAINKMRVWDQEAFAEFELDAASFSEENLGYIVPNDVLIEGLLQVLKTYSKITILEQCTVLNIVPEKHKISIVTNLGIFLAGGIAAADGANSSIRKFLDIAVDVIDYQQTAIVATIESDALHHGCALQRFSFDGPLAFLPLHDPRHSSIVWSTTPIYAQELMSMSKEQFSACLEQEIAIFGTLQLVSERLSFNLKQQRVKIYAKERCALLGDAAHVMHPLAGWGVNLGLLDVARLCEYMLEAKKINKDLFSSKVLSQYQRACKANNWVMLSTTDWIKRLFGSKYTTFILGRNVGMNWFLECALMRNMAFKVARGDFFGAPKLARRIEHDN